jgi:hypothetical protein
MRLIFKMTVQYTSYRAYNEIAKDLPERQEAVFIVLSQKPEGMTCKEIARALMKDANEIIPRLDELNRKGLVCRCLKRFDKITGKLAITWRAVTTDPQGRLF